MRRVSVDGKHLQLEGGPFRVRGVTYGSFVARLDGEPFPEHSQIKQDFTSIEAAGLNVVRTYDLPPTDVIDLAGEMGLRLLVGTHYEDWRHESVPGSPAQRRVRDAGRRAVAETMERCAGRPEVLAVAVGNEVPADVVRVHGIGRVEETLSTLVEDIHAADPDMPAAYCNFPTTEYLQVEGLDLVCFNVFLEDPDAFRRYARHLQIVSGDLPLILTELGLASNLHGEPAQAEALERQLRIVDEAGCGATVFSWTDEWGVDGRSVEGWGFGVTDSDRNPKPALDVVERWARSDIRDLRRDWPSISAVVCAYNGDQLIEKCLTSLQRCDYPELEVLVCDDGSTDRTLEIARSFPFKILELQRGGLSAARNAGLQAAGGEIVAFIDADAFCHPEWPYHLALSMEDDNVVATGGPNLPVSDVSLVERAVAASPGGPVHVLISDDRSEHVPGCNMAFRRSALEEVGGFDPVYTAAGDDVDVCWKLLDRGYEIAFAPAAQVHHHRRDTVGGYLRQQKGYGRAERLVAARHPHRFNRLGQARWSGFIYGTRFLPRLLRPIVYHGYEGRAAYQPVVRRPSDLVGVWASAFLPIATAAGLIGLAASPLWGWSLIASGAAPAILLFYAIATAVSARPRRDERHPLALRALVGFMHLAQPIVRVWGRIGPRRRTLHNESFEWTGDRTKWLDDLQSYLSRRGCSIVRARVHDSWDLEVKYGPFVTCRLTTAVAWRWNPISSVRYRPRYWLLPAAAAVAGLGLLDWVVGLVSGLCVASIIGIEGVLLQRRVNAAITATTTGSRRGEMIDEEIHQAGT